MKKITRTLALASLAAAAMFPTEAQPDAPRVPGEPLPVFAPPAVQEEIYAQVRDLDRRSQAEARRHEDEARRHQAEARAHGMVPPVFGPDRIPKPLLVFTSSPDETVTTQLQEDLAVMSRILDKNVKEVAASSSFTAMGINVLTFPNTRPSRNVYIEDYGVIFTLRVNMPLIPAPREEKTEEPQKEELDTAWEEAKSEIFGVPVNPRNPERGPQYDASSVEDLKKTLIGSLRNASNIRNLDDSDWVTIVVSGQPSNAPTRTEFHRALRFEFKEVVLFGEGGEEGSSTMVLRAKKSDIDQFAKEKDDDAFAEKVSVAIY